MIQFVSISKPTVHAVIVVYRTATKGDVYGQYSDRNLIKYEETIQLHFDTTGKMAWLTLSNYGVVFHMFPWAPRRRWSEVIKIAIGISAGGRFDAANLLPLRRTISIGAMLDVFDVIKIQVEFLKLWPYLQDGKVWKVDAEVGAADSLPLDFIQRLSLDVVNAHMLIESAFSSIGFSTDNFSWYPRKGKGYKWATSATFFP